jgi:pimeloyl-ACP methyl ester carboxylesterase/DNA-binding CsgD family transcriptional regulator
VAGSKKGVNSTKPDVVELIYAVLSNPEKMNELVEEMSADYERTLGAPEVDGPIIDWSNIQIHFDQAAELFERLRVKSQAMDAGMDVATASNREPLVWLNAKGLVTHCSDDGAALLSLSPGMRLKDLSMDGKTLQSALVHLRQVASGNGEGSFRLLPIYGSGEQRIFLGLKPIDTPRGDAVAHLSLVEFGWSGTAGQTIVNSFGLSLSEQDILKSIVQGKTLNELALLRKRSIATVRTQAKSLLAKTGARSQTDLVRIFAAVSLANRSPIEIGLSTPETQGGQITLKDGRLMQVEQVGAASARPVLLLHNMFGSVIRSPKIEAALARHGLRLVLPWRPGFAGSSWMVRTPQESLQGHVEDLREMMDQLGIERTVVLGQVSGSFYAAAAAKLLPDRVAGSIAIGGLPPILSRSQIDNLPAWPRLFAYTARYFPKVLSMLIRGSTGLIPDNRLGVLLDNMYAASAADSAVIKDPALHENLVSQYRRAFSQGTVGYEMDTSIAASDWACDIFDGLRDPIIFVHGCEDQVTPIAQLHDVASKVTTIQVMPVEGAGQLILQQYPDVIFELAARILVRNLDGNPLD